MVWIEEPLIPSYVFVLLSPVQHEYLYEAPGAVSVVSFRGRAAVVREEEIAFLRRVECHGEGVVGARRVSECGRPARIIGGIFAGYAGTVVRCGERCTVAVAIDELGMVVQVQVPRVEVEIG